LFAPAKTPQHIIAKVSEEMNRIVLLPEVKAKLAELGFDSVGWAPPKTNQFLKEQLAQTRKLVESGRVKL
jgi:tripartite-type tricarboxylate transporter receptor subunit TctC